MACAAAGAEELQSHSDVAAVAKAAERSAAEVLLKWSTQRGTPTVVSAATAADVGIDEFFTWRMSEERVKVGPFCRDLRAKDRKGCLGARQLATVCQAIV